MNIVEEQPNLFLKDLRTIQSKFPNAYQIFKQIFGIFLFLGALIFTIYFISIRHFPVELLLGEYFLLCFTSFLFIVYYLFLVAVFFFALLLPLDIILISITKITKSKKIKERFNYSLYTFSFIAYRILYLSNMSKHDSDYNILCFFTFIIALIIYCLYSFDWVEKYYQNRYFLLPIFLLPLLMPPTLTVLVNNTLCKIGIRVEEPILIVNRHYKNIFKNQTILFDELATSSDLLVKNSTVLLTNIGTQSYIEFKTSKGKFVKIQIPTEKITIVK
ncbi:hypothetical protein [Desulfovibrio gilichinskyi]|uniref:Uncharacterized protein n=1 Tax=Desulfovibrio gilichinskyi TaxID=1519643 RepID=A0A1X7EYE6_9BACT|nr:hypothetical protein [Desulfovibrio gilichinskyi]SMF42237.1 hypothetical protein SAMN06295933_3480 [Desulfovibrio gilichinskyi]